jgi:hypothetical protein
VPPLGISGVQLNAAIASGSGSLVNSVAFSMTGAVNLGIPLVTLNNVRFVYQRRVGSVRASRRCPGATPPGVALRPPCSYEGRASGRVLVHRRLPKDRCKRPAAVSRGGFLAL